ncbi:MAG TPA: hypothetical protein DDW84_05900 [Phycisphaerales bacterium]|nr:MAG: hypothetical protein A2Y13_04635 [Planctomycetes bacterium GWC2_45_44]HAL44684.1 hypothetical protein [Phycisphaerales bacterium]HBG78366.1 hypothetical protein [Phycisphaerales bacterium]
MPINTNFKLLSRQHRFYLHFFYYLGGGVKNLFFYAAYEYLKSEFCYADLNLDGYISLTDIEVMAGQWLIYPCADCISDLNSDQRVNMKDFAEFARQFAILGCR